LFFFEVPSFSSISLASSFSDVSEPKRVLIPLYAKATAQTPVAKNHAVRSTFFPDSSFHFSLSQTLFHCSETKFLVEAQIHGFSSEGLAFSVVLNLSS
jgi:hypothetical protein